MVLIQWYYLLQRTFKSLNLHSKYSKILFSTRLQIFYLKILNLQKLFLELLKECTFDFVFQNQQHIEESQTGWAGGVGFLVVLYFDLMKSYSLLHLYSSVLKHEASFWVIQHYWVNLWHCRMETLNAVLGIVSCYLLSQFKNPLPPFANFRETD